ncbi:hypothetical protein AC249_AIPGENE18642 [Exaiptasia diaphana]|nr:hypothetical protein AC249_AIPGENE18642 [Exaiptasia diaphana]
MTSERKSLNGAYVDINCPPAQVDYQKYIGGVDLADQLVKTLSTVRKSRKAWKELFGYGLESAFTPSQALLPLMTLKQIWKHFQALGSRKITNKELLLNAILRDSAEAFVPGINMATCISPPDLHSPLDITVFMDIPTNPGPQTNRRNTTNSTPRQRKSTELSVFYANARSIVNKITSIALEIRMTAYDIIILTETHLDNTVFDTELLPENYTLFRRDREINGRLGGGVLIGTLR